MPIRIPAAQATEVVSFGVAGLGVFAPLYLLLPGAEEHVARQTTRWAPRWENIATNHLAPPVEHVIRHHVTPPVERAVQRVDRRLSPHMARAAQNMDRRIRAGIERAQK